MDERQARFNWDDEGSMEVVEVGTGEPINLEEETTEEEE